MIGWRNSFFFLFFPWAHHSPVGNQTDVLLYTPVNQTPTFHFTFISSPYTGPSWLETRIYELRLKVHVQYESIYTSHTACVASTPIISLTQSISLRLCVLTCGFWPLTDTHWDTAAPKINHPVLLHSAYPQNTVHSCTYTVIIHDHRRLTHTGTLTLTGYTSSIEFLPLCV